jgi:hypothetical protein
VTDVAPTPPSLATIQASLQAFLLDAHAVDNPVDDREEKTADNPVDNPVHGALNGGAAALVALERNNRGENTAYKPVDESVDRDRNATAGAGSEGSIGGGGADGGSGSRSDTDADTDADTRRRYPPIGGLIRRGGALPVARRLAIYHAGYRARLIDALRDTFGHTARLLGAGRFDELALRYVERHPSHRPSLRWYGDDFARCLGHWLPQDGALAELAALDWALRAAFDCADAQPLDLAALAAVPPAAWDGLRLRLLPGCTRLTLRYDTLALWHALDADQPPPPAYRLAEDMPVLIWRRDLQPHFRSLSVAEALAIDRTLAADTFADTCAALAALGPEIDPTHCAGACLRRWIEDGLIIGIEHPA